MQALARYSHHDLPAVVIGSLWSEGGVEAWPPLELLGYEGGGKGGFSSEGAIKKFI